MNRDGAREEKMEGLVYIQPIMLNLFNKKLVYLFVQSIQTNNDETSNWNLNIFAKCWNIWSKLRNKTIGFLFKVFLQPCLLLNFNLCFILNKSIKNEEH